jgi:hypothetical protein
LGLLEKILNHWNQLLLCLQHSHHNVVLYLWDKE